VNSGFIQMGGAILEEPPREREDLKIMGSALVAVGSSREEVIAQLKDDVYVKEGVWDLSKIQIYPFIAAVRKEKKLT